MKRARSFVSFLCIAVVACGGGGGQTTSGGAGEGGGGESPPPVTDAEMEGFDTEGFEHTDPSGVQHGSGSARELIGVHSPPQPWDSMSQADQEYWMVGNVMPIHAEMFRGYDAQRYATFECATCHGDDAEERHYEMPSRFLPPLPEPNTPGWTRMQERNPRGVQFMVEEVTPTIRTQVGQPEFGCFGCHPHAS
jgi:hypothetical protein